MLIPFFFVLIFTISCSNNDPIRLITCGGTIDMAGQNPDGIYTFNESFVPKMLKQGRCQANYTIQNLFAKDSLLMNDEDRQLVLQAVANAPEERILITHGTDSIVNTSKVLGQNIHNKTVVLIGAMVPYIKEDSDALFNLGFGIASALSLTHGVYVCMHGINFDWYNVKKNLDLQKFETLSDPNSKSEEL